MFGALAVVFISESGLHEARGGKNQPPLVRHQGAWLSHRVGLFSLAPTVKAKFAITFDRFLGYLYLRSNPGKFAFLSVEVELGLQRAWRIVWRL